MSELFNIYYLNFQKAFEISMAIDNKIMISQAQEGTNESNKRHGATVDISGEVDVPFLSKLFGAIKGSYNNESKESHRIIDTYEVKMTKSVILKEIKKICFNDNKLKNYSEGQLVQLENVNLKLIDEENTLSMKALANGLFKGLEIPEAKGMDVNNIFDSMLRDYFYKLEGNLEHGEKILIKIPMSNDNEFENKYSINDILVGNVSLIGIYKEELNEKEIRNTVDFFSEIGSDVKTQSKPEIIPADTQSIEEFKVPKKNEEKHHYIDIISILQPIKAQVSN